MPAAALDFLDHAFTDDPYPTWRRLREHDPVWWWPEVGAWLVTGFPEMAAVLREPMFSPSRKYWSGWEPVPVERQDLADRLDDHGLFHVPAHDHLRLRRLVTRAFTPRGVEQQRLFTERLVDELLGQWTDGDVVDLQSQFASQIPSLVVANLLGFEGMDATRFRSLAARIVPLVNPLIDALERATAVAAMQEILDLLDEAVSVRRTDPRDDLLTRLLEAEAEGERLRYEELQALVVALVIAGSDTTANQIAAAILCLIDHPEAMSAVQHDPALIDAAVAESLRFLPLFKAMPHFAVGDSELGGHRIGAGQIVFFSMPAAHRDPRVFPEPDRFDLYRDHSLAMPFGGGPHYCLGAALARLEIVVAVGALVRRFPAVELAGPVRYRSHFIMRPLEALPIRLLGRRTPEENPATG